MKKFLSLMLTLALILTTLALPVSAANISLLDVGTDTIELSYVAHYPNEASTVRPGESFTVDVVASSEAISAFYTAMFKLSYDSSLFEYVASDSSASDTSAELDLEKYGTVRYIYENGNLALTDGSVTLATLKFNVKDTAFESLSKVVSSNDKDTAFTVEGDQIIFYDFDSSNLTETSLNVSVSANTAIAKIGDKEIEDKTYYEPNGVTVKYEGTNITKATITKEGGSAGAEDIPAEGKAVTESGVYKVNVLAKGGVSKEYTFTLSTTVVNAKLNITGDINDSGYEHSSVISMPVTISGLGTATADVISFDVIYDNDEFGLEVEGEDVKLNTTTGESSVISTVLYDSTKEIGIAANETPATVATLKFTVKDNAAYGDHKFTITNPKLALDKENIDPTADKINIETEKKEATIIPTGEFVSIGEGKKTDWDNNCSGTGYSQTVTVNTDVANYATVKYVPVSKLTAPDTTTQTGLASIYNSETASDLKEGKMNIASQSDYYIIAKIGSVYILADTLQNGVDVFYDGDQPTLNVDSIKMTDWAKDKTISKSDINATDSLSGIGKYEILIDDEYIEITDSSAYTFNATTNSDVTIKVTDKAGNSMTGSVKIMVDKTVPEASIEAGAQSEGKKELNISAIDNESGVTSTVVEYCETEDGEYTQVSATEGKYYATVDGWYRVTVTDKVGNTNSAKVNVTIDHISGTSNITVSVVNGEDGVENGFLTKTDMAKKGIKNRNDQVLETNGTYTYVKITVAEPINSKYTNEVQYRKLVDGEGEFTTSSNGIVELGQNEIGDYEVKVITKNVSVEDDKAESVYAFSIVTPEDMVSVNADNRFNIIDYAFIKKAVGSSDTGVLPAAEAGFWGGLYSGDVTGDFTMKADDLAAIIASLRKGETPGNYAGLKIMNQTSSSTDVTVGE